MKFIFFTYFSLLFSCYPSFSQVINWQLTIGGSGSEYPGKIIQTNDGGFLIGGTSDSNISGDKTENSKGSTDYWIIKTDISRNIQWQKTIGGDYGEILNDVKQTNDGGFILAGISYSNISGDKTENCLGQRDFWIVKTDSLGNILWQNTIGGNYTDEVKSVLQTSDGGYIFGGYSDSNISGDKSENCIGFYDYWIVKTDSNGNIVWQNTIGGDQYDNLSSVCQTMDGGYLLGGSSESHITGDKTENNKGGSDYWILKIDSSGNILWQNTIGGTGYDYLTSFFQTMDGGFILGGYSESNISFDKSENSQGNYDYWIVKTDSLGNTLWQNTIGGDQDDELISLQPTGDGGFFLGGYSLSGVLGDKNNNSRGGVDFWVLKTDSVGNIAWQNSFGGSNFDYLNSAIQTNNGEFILCGSSLSPVSGDKSAISKGNYDFWIVNITEKFNRITGKLFIDLNSNQVHDNNEHYLINHPVYDSNSGRHDFSQSGGIYSVSTLDSGTFNAHPGSLAHFSPSPAQFIDFISGFNETDSLNDFAFQPTGINNDLQITITPVSAFRPGFNASYKIHYRNIGTTVLTGTIIFYPDSGLTYINSTVIPNSISVDSIVWLTAVLNPFDEGDILVTLNINQGILIGSTLNSLVKIQPVTGDATPGNNFASWEVPVTGSFDPNDILVNRSSIETTELLSPPFLDYIIRFQNTGNDTAFTVIVNNPLPDKADLLTFEFVESSHPVSINFPNQNNLLWFTFNNILLPDSSTDELNSHGYLRYRIKPISSLVAGDSILNNANIYFDFNNPVVTNTAFTNIILPVSLFEAKSEFEFTISPNPATTESTLSFHLTHSKRIFVELFNSLGMKVLTIGTNVLPPGINEIKLPLTDLQEGIYQLRISSEKQACSGILVKLKY